MAQETELSELEGATLGIVWDIQPCTAYAIRRVFLTSPSPSWSGSAGAIYPLVERLSKRGLVVSEAFRTGRRPGRQYTITPAGLETLRAWIGPPIQPWVSGVPVDSLRTRVRFLAALPPGKRDRFLADALAGIDIAIRAVDRDARLRLAEKNVMGHAVGRGALLTLRARRAWLREVRALTSGRRFSRRG